MDLPMQSRLIIGFRQDGHDGGAASSMPATVLKPEWAALLTNKQAYRAIEKRRATQANAMACPDKRLHPYLCNCKHARVLIATPKTKSFKRVHAKQQRLQQRHLRGATNMYERVSAAATKYTPFIPAKRKAHYLKAPPYELRIPLGNPLEAAALNVQRAWRGCVGRNKYRKVYFFHSVRTLARYFDNWKSVVAYQHNLRRIAAGRFIQRNVRAIRKWRVNRDHFLIRARQMTTLLSILERLLKYKILHCWRDAVLFRLHLRKFQLTWFHLRRNAALCKLFRAARHHILKKTLHEVWWQNVKNCTEKEYIARCTIVISRWKKLIFTADLVRYRRKRLTFKAWAFYWTRSKAAKERRYRYWAAGIFQREIRAFLARHHYQQKMTAMRLINRVWRGSLGRIVAHQRWLRQHNYAIFRVHFSVWFSVAVLWKKQRVYRENVAARIDGYGVHAKTGEWSNVEEALERSWVGSSFKSTFPRITSDMSPYPLVGLHIEDNWKPPSEWGMNRNIKSKLWGKARGSAFMFLRGMLKKKRTKKKKETEKETETKTEMETETKTATATEKEEAVLTLTVAKAKLACAGAACRGHLSVLQWLRSNGCEWDEDVMSEAALSGHLRVLKWAYEQQCPFDGALVENAALAGHIHVLKWTSEMGLPRDIRLLTKMAARGQQLATLKWLSKTQPGFAVHPMCVVSAILGSANIGEKDDENEEVLEIIEWLFENAESVHILTVETCAAAAKRGRLECLKWLRRFGTPWDWRTLTACREMKRKKILGWVMKNGGKIILQAGDKQFQ
jgi:hypothetical protein